MSKKVKTTAVLSEIYRTILRDKILTRNQLLIGPTKTMGLQFDTRKEGAFTTVVGKSHSKLMVVIGGKLVKDVAKLPDEFTNRAVLKELFPDIISAFYAIDYHEMGHVLFTDMFDRTIMDYPMPQYKGFLMQLFNIIEDPVVECSIANLFDVDPKWEYEINPQEFFDFLIERMFSPEEYKDDKQITGFMNYLLLLLRCGKAAIKENCEVFEKYKEGLLPLIKDAFYEPNATERIHKVVKLGEWIIENIKEFSWELPEPPEELPSPEKMRREGTPTPLPSTTSGGTEDKFDESDGDVDEEGEEADKEKEEAGEDDSSKEESKVPEVEESVDDMQEEMDDIFNDIFHDGDDHEWVIAKDEYDVVNEDVIQQIDEIADGHTDAISDVAKFLTLFKGRIKPREQSGFTRGKLNVFRAMQDELKNGCDIKLFNQKIARGQDKDLAVSLLCDNSGSMIGCKSEICAQAAIVLAEACDRAGIPFECNCFTKTEDNIHGTSITIVQKSFDDSFEKAKPYFAINNNRMVRKYLTSHRNIPTFRGNSEEVNLYYVWKKFARVNHKTKLLFVLCDGLTTGSSSDLKTVVRNIGEEDHIVVIGIGICCPVVANIYPTHKIFNSISELQTDLAPYLVDTISKYAV